MNWTIDPTRGDRSKCDYTAAGGLQPSADSAIPAKKEAEQWRIDSGVTLSSFAS
jgi:hypothetical protein